MRQGPAVEVGRVRMRHFAKVVHWKGTPHAVNDSLGIWPRRVAVRVVHFDQHVADLLTTGVANIGCCEFRVLASTRGR